MKFLEIAHSDSGKSWINIAAIIAIEECKEGSRIVLTNGAVANTEEFPSELFEKLRQCTS